MLQVALGMVGEDETDEQLLVSSQSAAAAAAATTEFNRAGNGGDRYQTSRTSRY